MFIFQESSSHQAMQLWQSSWTTCQLEKFRVYSTLWITAAAGNRLTHHLFAYLRNRRIRSYFVDLVFCRIDRTETNFFCHARIDNIAAEWLVAFFVWINFQSAGEICFCFATLCYDFRPYYRFQIFKWIDSFHSLRIYLIFLNLTSSPNFTVDKRCRSAASLRLPSSHFRALRSFLACCAP